MTTIEFTKQEALTVLEDRLGSRPDDNAFRRYRRAAGIPVKRFYTTADVKALAFIGGYLKRDRSLERAAIALKRQIED